MPNIIRLGDKTSHGGTVVDVAATHYTIGGIAVARVGDRCSCPVQGHDGCTIAEGNPATSSRVSRSLMKDIKQLAEHLGVEPSCLHG